MFVKHNHGLIVDILDNFYVLYLSGKATNAAATMLVSTYKDVTVQYIVHGVTFEYLNIYFVFLKHLLTKNSQRLKQILIQRNSYPLFENDLPACCPVKQPPHARGNILQLRLRQRNI